MNAGDPAGAESLFSRALAVSRKNVNALYGLANAHQQTGRVDEGIRVIKRAIKLDPRAAPLHATLGLLNADAGQLGRARDAFSRACELQPENAAYRINLAVACHRLADLGAAETEFRHAIQIAPTSLPAWLGLGNVLLQDERPDEALACHERARTLAPDDPDVLMTLGTTLRNVEQNEAALACFRTAAAHASDPVAALHATGITLRSIGRADEAIEEFRSALRRSPAAGRVRISLAYTRRHEDRDEEVREMERIAADPAAAAVAPHDAWFAWSKVLRDLGEFEPAFDVLDRANAARRATFQFSLDEQVRRFARVAEVFADAPEPRGLEDDEPERFTPVFLLGMPRSGTSLIEQIVASHPDAHGAGEVAFVPRIIDSKRFPGPYPDGFLGADPATIRAAGREYLDRLRRRSRGKRVVTDKGLINFFYVGAIRAMVPGARFVHCVRDARDTCLSIYEQNFDSDLAYAFDQREIAQFHRSYEGLMDHWRRVLGPDLILDVHYENLVEDLEGNTRRILDHVGLDWHPDCLHFYRTERAVQTASMLQVREPAYTSSVGRWRRSAHRLGAMLEVLGATA